jgi:4-amino-4-deoxy-L-arabinose transferase-like glycosyltransferase
MTPSSLTAPDNSSFRLSLSVVLVATIVRIIVIVFMGEGLHRDPDAYRKIAENLRETGTFGFRVTDRAEPASGLGRPGPSVVRPTAYRPPLYPLLLAPLVFNGELWVAGVAILHVIGGVGTVWLVCQLGRQWGLGRSAWWGALAVALDPILVFQTAQLMTETLATLCGVVGLSGLTRWLDRRRSRDAFLAGMAMGLACLCRPTFLPWSGVAIPQLPDRRRPDGRREPGRLDGWHWDWPCAFSPGGPAITCSSAQQS